MTTATQYAALRALQRSNLRVSSATILHPGPAQQPTVHHTTARALCDGGWAEIQDTHDERWCVLLPAGRELMAGCATEEGCLAEMQAAMQAKPVPVPSSRQQYDKMPNTPWQRLCAQLPDGTQRKGETRNQHIDRVWELCVQYHAPKSVPQTTPTETPTMQTETLPATNGQTLDVTPTNDHATLEKQLYPAGHANHEHADGTACALFEAEVGYLPRSTEELDAYVEGGETWSAYHQSNPNTPAEPQPAIAAQQETTVSAPKKPAKTPPKAKPTIASLTAERDALRDEVKALKAKLSETETMLANRLDKVDELLRTVELHEQKIRELTTKPAPVVAAAAPTPKVTPKPEAKPQPVTTSKPTKQTSDIPSDDKLRTMKTWELETLCTELGIRKPIGAGHSALFRLLGKVRDSK